MKKQTPSAITPERVQKLDKMPGKRGTAGSPGNNILKKGAHMVTQVVRRGGCQGHRMRGEGPSGGSEIVFGDERPLEQETIPVRPESVEKHKELSGSGIRIKESDAAEFSSASANNNDQNSGNYITDIPSTRVQQHAGGISQITFGGYDTTPEKLPAHELAKHAEIQGNMEDELQRGNPDDNLRWPSSEKKKELLDSAELFGAPAPFQPSITPLTTAQPGEDNQICKIRRDEEEQFPPQVQACDSGAQQLPVQTDSSRDGKSLPAEQPALPVASPPEATTPTTTPTSVLSTTGFVSKLPRPSTLGFKSPPPRSAPANDGSGPPSSKRSLASSPLQSGTLSPPPSKKLQEASFSRTSSKQLQGPTVSPTPSKPLQKGTLSPPPSKPIQRTTFFSPPSHRLPSIDSNARSSSFLSPPPKQSLKASTPAATSLQKRVSSPPPAVKEASPSKAKARASTVVSPPAQRAQQKQTTVVSKPAARLPVASSFSNTKTSAAARKPAAAIKQAKTAETELQRCMKALQAEQEGRELQKKKLAEAEAALKATQAAMETLVEERDAALAHEEELVSELARSKEAAAGAPEQGAVEASTSGNAHESTETDISSLQAQLDAAVRAKEALASKVKELETIVASSAAQIASLAQDKEGLTEAAKKADMEVVQLSEKLERAQLAERRAREDAASTLEAYKIKNADLLKELSKVQGDLATFTQNAFREEMQTFRDQQATHQAEMQVERNEIKRLTNRIEADRIKLVKMQNTIDNLNLELQLLKDGNPAALEAFSQTQLQELQEELDATKRALNVAETETANLLTRLGMDGEAGPSNAEATDSEEFDSKRV